MKSRAVATADPLPWYEHELEVLEAEEMLLHADVLKPDDAGPGRLFRQCPEDWDAAYKTCRRIQWVMIQNGIPPREGWGMTLRELAERAVSR
jgi:hypothetical protein